MAASTIKLESSDGVVFDVEARVIKFFGTIKTMLDDGLVSDKGDEEAIPLPNVNEKILRKILDWAEHHVDDPEEPEYEYDDAIGKRSDRICAWDSTYMQVDQQMLADILLAANYLDVKDLVLLCCKTAANMMRGKTATQIRRMFNIENDFGPGEESRIQRRHQFYEERSSK